MIKTIVTSLLVTLVVVGGVLVGGFFGLDKLQVMFQPGQPEAQRVIVELKDTAIDEIRSAKSEAIDEIKELNAEMVTKVRELAADAEKVNVPAFEDMKKMVERIDANQKELAKRLETLNEKQAGSAAQVSAEKLPAELRKGVLLNTVYFPLAIAKGIKIDAQLAKIIPELKIRSGQAQCLANVSGFSDTLGNDDSNLKLSQKRANYVAVKLKAEGLAIGTVRGWGERRLKVHTLDGADNENNRRVEIEINCPSAPTA